MVQATRLRIGDRLLETGAVTQEQVDLALSEQRRAHRPLGEILVSLGFVKEEDIARLVAQDLGLPFVRAAEIEPDPLILSALDADFVREMGSFPFALAGGSLRVATVHPDDPARMAAVRKRFPYPLQLAITTQNDIAALLRLHLRSEQSHVAGLLGDLARGGRSYEDYPVEQLTHAIILDGVHKGATDIHIEPDERVTRVRYRVDGILRAGENLPVEITAAVISRVKILSGLDISERRRPQEGRIRMAVDARGPQRTAAGEGRRSAERSDARQVDLRVSILPTADGENVVIRILDRTGVSVQIPALGVPQGVQRDLLRIAERSHGLFLVTGPTGSGKTTTLYALLGSVDSMRRNVCTIEDPIEYKMPLLRQSQVDLSIGFGFQEGLRALLRQDPDVILLGEIRDHETADMAIKASMTGHLVFSTLHTNSAIGAIPRLVDIGVDAFLLEDTLIGVLAQRLVRRICSRCTESVAPSEEDLRWLGGETGKLSRGRGCERCDGSGYSGRMAICELFLPDEEIAAAIRRGADQGELFRLARAAGFRTMSEDGVEKVRAGLTTREEVERVNRNQRLGRDERADARVHGG